MKCQMFTHNDLDGVVSNILFCRYLQTQGIGFSAEVCHYENIDKNIMGYLNSRDYSTDDLIIITDITPSYDTMVALDEIPNKKIHLDHHATSIVNHTENDGKAFDWSTIIEGDSASLMSFKYIKKKLDIPYEVLKPYESLTVLTDLWDSKPRDSQDFLQWKPRIEEMTVLFKMLGMNNFKARFLSNPDTTLTSDEAYGYKVTTRQRDQYIKYVQVYKIPYEFRGNRVLYGVCFADQYISEVATYICDNDSNIKFVFVITMNGCSVSLRRANGDDLKDMDLSKIAVAFGGGGHPFSCAFRFDINDYSKVINKIMSAKFDLE